MLYSQVKDTSHLSFGYYHKEDISLLLGYHQGDHGFADIGIAWNKYGINRHPYSLDYFISNEIRIGNKTVIGPKVGIWVGAGFATGLNMIYYTDFHQGSLVLRPEFGLGIEKAKLVYGYNIRFNSSFNAINRHLVGLTWCLTIKRLVYKEVAP